MANLGRIAFMRKMTHTKMLQVGMPFQGPISRKLRHLNLNGNSQNADDGSDFVGKMSAMRFLTLAIVTLFFSSQIARAQTPVFGVFASSDKTTVIFVTENNTDTDLRCDEISVEVVYVDGQGAGNVGLLIARIRNFLIPAKSSQFQIQGGLDTLAQVRAQFPEARIGSLSSLRASCKNAPSQKASLALGSVGACAIQRHTGKLFCWGDRDHEDFSPPPFGTPELSAIFAAYAHFCAVGLENQPICWGFNNAEQATLPANFGPVLGFGLGQSHTCAIQATSGRVACFGGNEAGAASPTSNTPTDKVVAGFWHSCSLSSSTGRVFCWGETPPPPAPLFSASDIAAGFRHTCAVEKNTRTVFCWGYNEYGEIIVPADLGPVDAVSAGEAHSCAIRSSDKGVTCWGDNSMNQLAVPQTLTQIQSIWSAGVVTCVLSHGSRIQCFGPEDHPIIKNFPAELSQVPGM
jgi:hypothetical protein